ncbi:hypothetical protein RFI_39318 [Reticulomyxa filosa]|uniref:VWFA domain-containing protein n=1 Tax=Reticulomyxa filosa TaxID=46433 RepID=X6L8A5_RETFI|nr:hypothetical protein RFI_39318 [Reticulomyxa filosa]|eukprot:ETN98197.1 hypothetical protein RFI_39318 [Reticulomyxa filosa]
MEMNNPKKIEYGTVPFHSCGSERHQCLYECKERGNCKVEYKRVINETKIFNPKTVGAKPFEYISYIAANGKKYNCSQLLPKYKEVHDGTHKCTETVHTCQSTCRACGYYCTKPFGHNGRHHTEHGNMLHSTFMVEDDKSVEFYEKNDRDIVRVYTTGDTAEAEICDFFCEKMGRGHFHLIKCNRHLNESCNIMKTTNNETYYIRTHANPDECGGRNDLDKVTHKYYWETYLKFEDPCKLPSQKQFERCNHFCSHPSHEQSKDERGNTPKKKKNAFCLQTFIKKRIFAIDVSGSMKNSDVKPKRKETQDYKSTLNADGLNNRLGAVYDAIHSFIQQRWRTGCRDKGTIIFYDNTAKIIKEDIAFHPDTVHTILYPASVPWGNTSFVTAIRCVYDVVKRNASKPIVLIFLTDGEDEDNGASELLAEIKAFCSNGFHFFPCIFCTSQSPTLNKMASTVGATVKDNLDANGLETHFVAIAKKLTNISFTQD